MNILLDNVNTNSSSGPNSFGKKLKKYLKKIGCNFSSDYDIQLSFISTTSKGQIPIVLRLDGIYFNTSQDYCLQNKPIEFSYQVSDGVVFQTEFNKELVFNYFGPHDNGIVIRNGADLDLIGDIKTYSSSVLDKFDKIWACASRWRPHKRLKENIKYFLEHSSEKECLIIAGDNAKFDVVDDQRIFYLGNISYENLLSLYKRVDYFVHLAWIDHCPNVVVDARAAGCKIICSSTGGTKEIAGDDAIIIEEDKWNYQPINLYNPPLLDFTKKVKNKFNSNYDMNFVAQEYLRFLKDVKYD